MTASRGAACDVIIVDNGSSEEDRSLLKTTCSYRVLWLDRNYGFAGGMNAGIEHAVSVGYQFFWLLNNDAFPETDCLATLVSALDANPALATVTPLLFDDTGEQHAGCRFDWRTALNKPLWSNQLSCAVSRDYWLTGTALLVRSDAIKTVGLFDIGFFAYWEEVDLCFRFTAAGFQFRAVQEARCRHLGSASTGGINSPLSAHLIARNRWRFMKKHGLRTNVILLLLRHIHATTTTVTWFAAEQPEVGRAILRGAFVGVLGHNGPPGVLALPRWTNPLLRLCGIASRFSGFVDRLLTGLLRSFSGSGR